MRIILIMGASSASYAQFWKKNKKRKKQEREQVHPTALNPLPKVEYAPRVSKKRGDGPTYESEQAYYDRMEALSKRRRKNERLMQKPQYADPSYFGHKRPPKKRKPSKMKFCKECGIRH